MGWGGGCCGGSFRSDSESASESDSTILDLDAFALDLDRVDLLGHAFLLLGLDLPVLDPVDSKIFLCSWAMCRSDIELKLKLDLA